MTTDDDVQRAAWRAVAFVAFVALVALVVALAGWTLWR